MAKGNLEYSPTIVRMYLLLLIVGSGPLNSMLILSTGCVALINLSCGKWWNLGLFSAKIRAVFKHVLRPYIENGRFFDLGKWSNRVTPGRTNHCEYLRFEIADRLTHRWFLWEHQHWRYAHQIGNESCCANSILYASSLLFSILVRRRLSNINTTDRWSAISTKCLQTRKSFLFRTASIFVVASFSTAWYNSSLPCNIRDMNVTGRLSRFNVWRKLPTRKRRTQQQNGGHHQSNLGLRV